MSIHRRSRTGWANDDINGQNGMEDFGKKKRTSTAISHVKKKKKCMGFCSDDGDDKVF